MTPFDLAERASYGRARREGRNITNLAFGGADRRTLFLTSGTPSGGGKPGNFGLFSLWLNVPGFPF